MKIEYRLVLLGVISVMGGPARAELGGVLDSVAKDERVLRATTRSVTPRGTYTVHELSTSTTEVREFARPDGRVFAVTWRGPKRPDLSSLLGAYFAEYDAADQRRTMGRGPRSATVRAARVVVERGGQMRDIHGKAYVPELVPAGVDVGSL